MRAASLYERPASEAAASGHRGEKTLTDAVADLKAAVDRRCTALMADDAETLTALLADDLVHIHLTGAVDDKAGYLAGVREKYGFADLERGPLTIRLYGEVAVMIGTLSQTVRLKATGETRPVLAMTTQVWLRCATAGS
jgi:hypothetical protein